MQDSSGAGRIVFFALAVAVSSLACGQQIYRWLDKDGRVHFSEQPPPGDARGVQTRRAPSEAADPASVAEMAAVAKKNPVTLYQGSPCEKPCEDGRALLTRRGVPFRVVDLGDRAAFERFQKEFGASGVPVLVVGTQVMKGFDPEAWTEALDSVGFPKSAPAPLRGAQPPPKPEPPRRGRYESELPASPAVARLFVAPDCAPCDEARKLFAGRGITVTEVSVADPAAYAELETLTGGTAVPVLIVGTEIIKGFEASRYEAALERLKQ